LRQTCDITCDSGEIEKAFIRAFITPDCRRRWIDKLERRRRVRGKQRQNIIHWLGFHLAHQPDINLGGLVDFRGRHQNPADIRRLLKSLGAPDLCHVIAPYTDIDDQKIPLQEALDKFVGDSVGAFIVCIPDKLGYWEGEYKERIILFRK
jgi:hypothetical protein